MTDSLIVSVELDGTSVDAGTAYFTRRRNTLTTSFRYQDHYLDRDDAYAIDPALELYAGTHRTEGLPGAFSDCSPDRWGKNLILKQSRAQALHEDRTAPSLSDVDYLLGVSDLTRQGALRFRASQESPYLSPDHTVPKLVELPRLLRAADAASHTSDDDMTAIKALLEAGSGSLGGARPKASIRDSGRLLIAKFPHRNDEWDVMAWEKTALDLAQRAGIDVPPNELIEIDGRQVLLVERFDRSESGRVGYISAMTLLGYADGAAMDYIEVAETLTEYGSQTVGSLHELWRRIAYSVIIHNTDDHLRNHGFLRAGRAGWSLSPAFDINPNPNVSEQRVTGIGGAYTRADELTGLLTYSDLFDLTRSSATTILREISEETRAWQAVASANGISKSEQKRFTAAFEDLRESIQDLTADPDSPPGKQPRSRGGSFTPKRNTSH